ncbi:MAG: sodium:proton antiporter [Planctomycetes bacterium]|nr:sodium:proton antiporter [Planctomycetota bacterium]
MNALDLAALLVVLAAAFGLVNEHLLRLPNAIGLLAVTLIASLAVKLLHFAVPSLGIGESAQRIVAGIDFHDTLMQGMLGFLLFAGALHVDFGAMKQHRSIIATLATVGVVISTFVVGIGFHLLTGMPFEVALVFGALISPTDPVAVLGILKTAGAPHSLETKIAGESLFNDGVGVVVFLITAAIAFPAAAHGGGDAHPIGFGAVAELFLVEAVGGAALGLAAGWLVWQLTRRVDDYGLEVLLTLALVMGSYSLATALHTSGPIAIVVAGLLIGHKGLPEGMSERTQQYVTKFWHLIDELLNAVLFLLIGLELLVIDWTAGGALWNAVAAIPLALAARWVAVAGPLAVLPAARGITAGSRTVMTWGGLRGGISVALALSLPASEHKEQILAATYVVVVFSILVQGLTLARVVRAVVPASAGVPGSGS